MDVVQPGPIFMKMRAVAFMCMTLVSLAWAALLCVVMFLKWNGSDFARSALLVILLCVNMITCIMLPALLLVGFRLWLDAARFLFLIFAHFMPAIGFTIWTTKFHCQAGDDGKCDMLNTYIMLGSWLNPLFILAYVLGLALAVYRWYKNNKDKMSTLPEKFDIEEASPTPPTPATLPPHSTTRSSSTALGPASKHASWRTEAPPLPSAQRSTFSPLPSSSTHLLWPEPVPPLPSAARSSFGVASPLKHTSINVSRPPSATTAPSVYSSQRGSFDTRMYGSKPMSSRASLPASARRGSLDTQASSRRSSMKPPRPSLSISTPPPLPSSSVVTLDYFDSPTNTISSEGWKSRSSTRLSKPLPAKYF